MDFRKCFTLLPLESQRHVSNVLSERGFGRRVRRLTTAQNLFERKRERENVLFNDALNTFYLRLYGFRHMVKDRSDSEKGNPLPPHRLLLSINSTIPTDRIAHTTAFITPVVEHWLEREIAQWVVERKVT